MASLLVLLFMATCLTAASSAGKLNDEVKITWGDGRGQILNNGKLLTLKLDNYSGSGFESQREYLYGKVEMQIKLVPGDSAGTVTTYYLSSQGANHDEIDFEFLGNVSGEPYTVHTNVFAQGKGDREQQFHLWFDPTVAFHTYCIDWNPERIIWLVDNSPIRVFHNNEPFGVSFPKSQPMKVYSSLWNADDWATQGGRVKTDWKKAPFTASYRNFQVTNACVHSSTSSCTSKSSNELAAQASQSKGLDENGRKRVRWVQNKHMIYNYCSDRKRFPGGLPKECKRPRFL